MNISEEQLQLYKLLESEIRDMFYPDESDRLEPATSEEITSTIGIAIETGITRGRIQGILDCISKLEE